MPTYKRCDPTVAELADEILCEFDTHEAVRVRRVKIDFLFAYPDWDEYGNPKNAAIKLHGMPALGLCRKISLKDRAKGMGDAEILLDHPYWEKATEQEQRALLDHELHHISVSSNQSDNDQLGRPNVKIRKHDVEIGWFKIIAARHGIHSLERKQAALILERDGQFFWPEIVNQTSEAVGRAVRRAVVNT